MDIDVLIACVFRRIPIWNKREKLHSNRNVVDKLWKEIGMEMEEDEQKIRKKWKYLRDQFAVELGKLPQRRSGDPADAIPVCRWPYFKQLFFLKDTVTPRKSTGNLSNNQRTEICTDESQSLVDNTENNSEQREEVEDENSVVETQPSQIPDRENSVTEAGVKETRNLVRKSVTNTTSITTPVTTKKRRAIDEFNASIMDIENRKLEYLESKRVKQNKEPEDEHILFFKSLLPHVRRIPESKVLSFRNAIQGVVQEYSYQDTFFPRPNSSASSYSVSSYQDQNSHSETSVYNCDMFDL